MPDLITTLHEVDPAFRGLVDLLYKSGPGPDGADLHTPGGGARTPRRRGAVPPSTRLVPLRGDAAVRKGFIRNLNQTASNVVTTNQHVNALNTLKTTAAQQGITPAQAMKNQTKAYNRHTRKVKLRQVRADLGDSALAHGQTLMENARSALAAGGPAAHAGPKVGRIVGASLAAGGAATALAVHHNNKNAGLTKQAEPVASVTWSGTIAKIDSDKRQVFGFASVSEVNGTPVVDLQGDWVPIEETEKAAYRYMLASRVGGDMHKRVPGQLGKSSAADAPLRTGQIIESFVITPEKLDALGIAKSAVPHGWWLGFQVTDDDAWNAIKTGQRQGFSIHGSGKRREIEL